MIDFETTCTYKARLDVSVTNCKAICVPLFDSQKALPMPFIHAHCAPWCFIHKGIVLQV